jgi:hypothetical protein
MQVRLAEPSVVAEPEVPAGLVDTAALSWLLRFVGLLAWVEMLRRVKEPVLVSPRTG